MAARSDVFAVIPREEAFSIAGKFKKHLEKIGIPVERIYVYGSYAKGMPRYGSDIDICVISPAFKERLETNIMLRREAIKIDSRIEPVGYHPSQFEDWIPLVWEIQSHGVLAT